MKTTINLSDRTQDKCSERINRELIERLQNSNVLIKALLSSRISAYREAALETIDLNIKAIRKATEL